MMDVGDAIAVAQQNHFSQLGLVALLHVANIQVRKCDRVTLKGS
jgi:hypothetical protein